MATALCRGSALTIRIPDDLPPLRSLSAESPHADAVVVFEERPGKLLTNHELFVEAVLAPVDSEYFELRTTGPEPVSRPGSALSFQQVLEHLEALPRDVEAKEVFWVSGLIPVPTDEDQELSRYSIRLALPITKIATDKDHNRIAFVAKGSLSRTT